MIIDAWKGYLLRGMRTGQIFPNNYIEWGTWKSTPNQREEIKAYRDDNTRTLTRVTASGMKTVFSFDIRPRIHLVDKASIQKFFENEETTELDRQQRRVNLQFWDDERNVYRTGYFYRPNLEFKILEISNNDIIYDKFTMEFIEY